MGKIVGLVLGCGLAVATVGCGDNGGGGGVDARRDGIILGDGPGGEGGVDAMADAGRPDAGPPVGMRLSNKGSWYLQVSQDGNFVVFADSANQYAHIVPTNMGADPAEKALGGNYLVGQQGEAFWVHNTAVIYHDANTTAGTAQAALWKDGMAAAVNVTTPLFGTAPNFRPFAAVSTMGTKVAFLVANGNNLDLKVQSIADGSMAATLTASIPGGTGCGVAGAWADDSTFLFLGCDVAASTTSLKKYAVPAVPPPTTTPIALSATGDVVQGFVETTGTDRTADGRFLAYYSMAGALKIVPIATPATPISVETTGIMAPGGRTPFGLFHSNTATSDLFYLAGAGGIKKATITVGTNALTSATLISTAVPGWAYSSISGSAFSNDGGRAIYFRQADTNVQFGSMSVIDTTSAPATAQNLNSDNNGYPGDDAYSINGTYVFWYDQVQANTNGIGRIHARTYNGTGDGNIVGPNGYFIRQTRDDNVAAVMANTTVEQDVMMTHVGDLLKADLTNGNTMRIVDQITYVDMLYPPGMTKAVYSRLDGVFVTNF